MSRYQVVWQWATSARPIACPASSSRTCREPEPKRCWKTIAAYGPPSPAPSAASIASKSSSDGQGGFSHHTHAPARSAATVWSRWNRGGVPMTTRSGRCSASIRSRSVYARAMPASAQNVSTVSTSTSTAATISSGCSAASAVSADR